MKKYNYILGLLVFGLLIHSCTQDIDFNKENEENDDKITFISSTSPTSKSTINDDYTVSWKGIDRYPNNCDKVGLFTSNIQNDVSNLKMWATTSASTSKLDYDAVLSFNKRGKQMQYFYAYAPYDENVSSMSNIKRTLPSTQYQVAPNNTEHISANDFIYDKKYFYDKPTNNKIRFEFSHLFSVIELKLKATYDASIHDNFNLLYGKVVKSVTFEVIDGYDDSSYRYDDDDDDDDDDYRNNSPILAGDYKVSLKDSYVSPYFYSSRNSSHSVTVQLPEVNSEHRFVLDNESKSVYAIINPFSIRRLSDPKLKITLKVQSEDDSEILTESRMTNLDLDFFKSAKTLSAGMKYQTRELDLQLYERSNCYMIYKPGIYQFYANRPGEYFNEDYEITQHYRGVDRYKYNSRGKVTKAHSNDYSDPLKVVPGIKSVDWLWSDARILNGTTDGQPIATVDNNKLIENIQISDDGIISFERKNVEAYGNVIIAAYNKDLNRSDKQILWTWHIWCPKGKPEIITISSGPNNNQYTGISSPTKSYHFLDRNVGAITASNSDVKVHQSLLSRGLFYQWGRKDPFIGGTANRQYFSWIPTFKVFNRNTSSDDNFYIVSAASSTIKNSVLHPTRFYAGKDSWRGDIRYTLDQKGMWAANRTMFDPSPYGYHVPDGNAYSWVNYAQQEHSAYNSYYLIRSSILATSNNGAKLNLVNGGYFSYHDGTFYLDQTVYHTATSPNNRNYLYDKLDCVWNTSYINPPHAYTESYLRDKLRKDVTERTSYGNLLRCVLED